MAGSAGYKAISASTGAGAVAELGKKLSVQKNWIQNLGGMRNNLSLKKI